MSLAPGTRLGPYEDVNAIGARYPFLRVMFVGVIAMAMGVLPSAQQSRLRVHISVADEEGRPIIREAPEVSLWEGGQPRLVVDAGKSDVPAAVVIIVHAFATSDTIDVRKALLSIVDALSRDPRGTRIALATSVAPIRLSDLAPAESGLRTTIDHFVTTTTNLRLFEAIVDACAALRLEAADRRHVLVITGAPDSERFTASRAIAALRMAGASLWVADLGSASTREETILFRDGTRMSGGVYQPVRRSALLPAASAQIAHSVANQIVVTFERAPGQRAGELRIEVDGPPGHHVLAPLWAPVR